MVLETAIEDNKSISIDTVEGVGIYPKHRY